MQLKTEDKWDEITTLRTDEAQNKVLPGGHAAQLVAVENGERGRDRDCSNYPNALSRPKKADDMGAGEMKDL